MKRSNQAIKILASSLALAAALLGSCSEGEEIAPETVSDVPSREGITFAAAPTTAEAPASQEVHEDIANLRFPGKISSSRNAKTYAYGVTDYVRFDDEMALTIIPDQAKYTFASSPFYIEKVGNAWIHVKENNSGYSAGFISNYNHYHLSYQNFEPCFSSGVSFGKPSGSACLDFNPVKENRTVNTHHGSQWIKIYAYDGSNPKRTFDLLQIQVTNGPIQLWFKKKSGGWWRWSSLGSNTWNLSAYCTDITEVLISGAGSSSIGFDNLKVNVPYY